MFLIKGMLIDEQSKKLYIQVSGNKPIKYISKYKPSHILKKLLNRLLLSSLIST